MPSLEHVVRPFQTGAVSPPRRMLPGVAGTPMPGDAPPANVSLTPGKSGGSAKTLSYSASAEETFYLDAKHREKRPPDAEGQTLPAFPPEGGGHEFGRVMIIQRVRNSKDKSQYTDVAITLAIITQTGEGQTFVRNVTDYAGVQLGDPDDRSDAFVVRSRADLLAQEDAFRAAHEDDDK
jgi:hypothetical protein